MGKIGYGYGSEWHLLWYLGRHRSRLNREVRRVTGAERVEWLDFVHSESDTIDAEWKGLAFIQDDALQSAWGEFWPQGAGIHHWDAVAQIDVSGPQEWLLVEAKAHTYEVQSDCGAKPHGGRDQIRRALDQTKSALQVQSSCDWMNGYYQFCNRVAVLHFLQSHGVPAHLLVVYFTGDSGPARECPLDESGWQAAIAAQDAHVGLPEEHALSGRIHRLFLPAFTNLHEAPQLR